MKLREDLNTSEVREALLVMASVRNWISPDHTINDVLNAIRAPEPCEPPIPWERLDKRWRFQAMDADGEWAVYTARPEMSTRNSLKKGWLAVLGSSVFLTPCAGSTHHWTETLCERPEEGS